MGIEGLEEDPVEDPEADNADRIEPEIETQEEDEDQLSIPSFLRKQAWSNPGNFFPGGLNG